MAKLSTSEIQEAAKAILEKNPGGMRFTPLWKQIAAEHPETNANTIFTQVSYLAKLQPTAVVKPSRGVYQLAKYAGAEPIPQLKKQEPVNNDKGFNESDFYESFSSWVQNELEEATVAGPLGGAGAKHKWGTPDVVGVYKPKAEDIYKLPLEIVTAEIKIDPTQSIVALGQAVAYRLFSHKCYLVMPHTIGEDDLGRLEALSLILGIGLILFDLDPKQPNYTIMCRAQRISPDMFYVNDFIHRLKGFDKPLYDKLFN